MLEKENSLSIPSNNKRITAFVIDDIFVSLLFIAIFYNQIMMLFSNFNILDESAMIAISEFVSQQIITIMLIKIIYHTVLVWQGGMTLGKYIMKIQVIDMQTHEIPNLPKSLLRAIVRIASETLIYIGFLLAFFVPLRQTMHDKISNCVVVDV